MVGKKLLTCCVCLLRKLKKFRGCEGSEEYFLGRAESLLGRSKLVSVKHFFADEIEYHNGISG